VWLVWQEPDATTSAGVTLAASNGWVPTTLPDLPRAEATSTLLVAGSPRGLVAIFTIATGFRAVTWPASGAPPTVTDYAPFSGATQFTGLSLSSMGSAIAWQGDNGTVGTFALDGGQQSSQVVLGELFDTPAGVMSFWPALSASNQDALLVGRSDVFTGPQLTFRTVANDATAIDACWPTLSPAGPLLLWRELDVLHLGLPSFTGGGGMVRSLRLPTDGGVPARVQPAWSGGDFTNVFYVADDNNDLSVIRSCAP
jgi:hypothetical protein